MPSHRPIALLMICALALTATGCRKRTVQAAPPSGGTVPAAEPAPQPSNPAPEAKTPPPENPAPPALVVPPPAKPPATKPAQPAPTQPRPAAPQISPRLSPAEQAEAERRTTQDISAAEKNLQFAYGKQLNAAQHDLIEKIRGFLGQAREAIRADDWVRARNLAQKAQALSIELASSL